IAERAGLHAATLEIVESRRRSLIEKARRIAVGIECAEDLIVRYGGRMLDGVRVNTVAVYETRPREAVVRLPGSLSGGEKQAAGEQTGTDVVRCRAATHDGVARFP